MILYVSALIYRNKEFSCERINERDDEVEVIYISRPWVVALPELIVIHCPSWVVSVAAQVENYQTPTSTD